MSVRRVMMSRSLALLGQPAPGRDIRPATLHTRHADTAPLHDKGTRDSYVRRERQPVAVTGLRSLCTGTTAYQSHRPTAAIDATQQLHDKRLTMVEWRTGGSSSFPWLWLRDNCQCDNCFHPVSLSRTFFLADLDLELRPIKTEVCGGDGSLLEVEWSDGHVTQHAAEWLSKRAFETSQRTQRNLVHKLHRKPWPETLPSFSWDAIMEDDTELLKWLQLLEIYGLVLITGAPQETGHVMRLAQRVAFVKRTHYGKDFSVVAKADPSNVAYSNATLALHLDLPYYFYKPGVQLIHCIQQYEGSGGESQVSDAATVAEQMRLAHPRLFHVLAGTPVDWVDQATEGGRDYFKTLKMPIICLEDDGKSVWRINFSQPQRDSYFTSCDVDCVAEWYEALKTYHDMLYHPNNCRTFKMKSGTLMTLDNLRVTHGRTGYPNTPDVRRHIDGCYVDWDEVRSRRRVLELEHGTQGNHN